MPCPFGFEPVHPRPGPSTPNYLFRLLRGLHSWLGLLNRWDFQIPIGGFVSSAFICSWSICLRRCGG